MSKSKRAIRRAEIWKTIQSYKQKQGCNHCGYNTSGYALQFNHINPATKRGNVSDLIRSDYSIKTVWEEIAKCEVLCANCHSITTHEYTSDQY